VSWINPEDFGSLSRTNIFGLRNKDSRSSWAGRGAYLCTDVSLKERMVFRFERFLFSFWVLVAGNPLFASEAEALQAISDGRGTFKRDSSLAGNPITEISFRDPRDYRRK
jgi:hypothetical protein